LAIKAATKPETIETTALKTSGTISIDELNVIALTLLS